MAGETVRADLRFAWRGLWRRPSLAVISLVTLALGISVNTALFSMFYAVLLKPLPYGKPEQLVKIWTTLRATGTARAPVSGTILAEINRRSRSLSGVAAIWVGTTTFTGDDPEQVRLGRISLMFPAWRRPGARS